jgi:NAD dependent epimerase/dehydratase family enzyme
MPTPAFLLKTLLGEMSAVVLNSTNVSAQKIVDTGFEFQYPHLDAALHEIYKE